MKPKIPDKPGIDIRRETKIFLDICICKHLIFKLIGIKYLKKRVISVHVC
jgi:hypothetical protein